MPSSSASLLRDRLELTWYYPEIDINCLLFNLAELLSPALPSEHRVSTHSEMVQTERVISVKVRKYRTTAEQGDLCLCGNKEKEKGTGGTDKPNRYFLMSRFSIY